MSITPRREEFDLSDVPLNWHSDCPGISNFYNALSLLFPEGETFFIDSARHYVGRLTEDDRVLLDDLRGFMTQEAVHTAAHNELNSMLERHGIKSKVLEGHLKSSLDRGRKVLPAYAQLGITVSLEHWTAVLAHALLADEAILEGAHPEMKRLWQWHAVEETEHKAVCFDLMKRVSKSEDGFHKTRRAQHILSALPFMGWITYFYLASMKQTGHLWNIRAHGNLIKYLWVKPGAMRFMMKQWGGFLSRDFHPWDHDNADLIETYENNLKGVAQTA